MGIGADHGIWAEKGHQAALAAIGEIADRLLGGDGDRLFRCLRQRHAGHAPRRGRTGAPDPGKSRLRHRFRHQPQHRDFRPVAARGGQQHGAARDRGRQQGSPAPDPVRPCRNRQAFRRDPGVRRRGEFDDRCLHARSAAGEPRRRGIFPDSSGQSRRRPLHLQANAPPQRLCDRAEPAHQRP